jgi:hypothetical protein
MSDDVVINQFVGEYESGGTMAASDDDLSWFPPPGVQLTFFAAQDGAGKPIAKVRAANTGSWSQQAKEAVEKAEYRVRGNRLWARMDFGGIPLLETVAMIPNTNRKMVHLIEFDSGEVGYWICPSKP